MIFLVSFSTGLVCTVPTDAPMYDNSFGELNPSSDRGRFVCTQVAAADFFGNIHIADTHSNSIQFIY